MSENLVLYPDSPTASGGLCTWELSDMSAVADDDLLLVALSVEAARDRWVDLYFVDKDGKSRNNASSWFPSFRVIAGEENALVAVLPATMYAATAAGLRMRQSNAEHGGSVGSIADDLTVSGLFLGLSAASGGGASMTESTLTLDQPGAWKRSNASSTAAAGTSYDDHTSVSSTNRIVTASPVATFGLTTTITCEAGFKLYAYGYDADGLYLGRAAGTTGMWMGTSCVVDFVSASYVGVVLARSDDSAIDVGAATDAGVTVTLAGGGWLDE